VGVIVRLVGYYGRDVDELASPLIQVLPEVVQDIVGFTNFKLGGEGGIFPPNTWKGKENKDVEKGHKVRYLTGTIKTSTLTTQMRRLFVVRNGNPKGTPHPGEGSKQISTLLPVASNTPKISS